jgi:hypothetical protein
MGRRFTTLVTILALAFMMTACRNGDERRPQAVQADSSKAPDGPEVTITGCLTGGREANAFVLTPSRDPLATGTLQASRGEAPTYTYELVGLPADLAPHVGRLVEIRGRVDPDVKESVDIESKTRDEQPAVRTGQETAAVETRQEIEVDIRRLHVLAATPTDRRCE